MSYCTIMVNQQDQVQTAEIKRILERATTLAYQRGWNAAMAEVHKMAMKAAHDADADISPDLNQGAEANDLFASGRRGGRPNTSETKVYQAIIALPGNTGAFIAGQLPDIHERTVRTALRRLRMKRKIEQRDKGWFAVSGGT